VTTRRNKVKKVDDLLKMRAELSQLKKQEAKLAEEIKAMGVGTYAGKTGSVQVIEKSQNRLDTVGLKKKLSRQMITAHTNLISFLQIEKVV
jgi:DNA-directed RNA polymerase subunit N (RpoN/RPB10)